MPPFAFLHQWLKGGKSLSRDHADWRRCAVQKDRLDFCFSCTSSGSAWFGSRTWRTSCPNNIGSGAVCSATRTLDYIPDIAYVLSILYGNNRFSSSLHWRHGQG